MADPGVDLGAGVHAISLRSWGISLAIVLPAVISVGILLTFRIAGPIYRFEEYLKAVARGENVGPCKIRKGDQLQPLCDAINAATDAAARAEESAIGQAGRLGSSTYASSRTARARA